jgi:hypothetical protein
MSPGSSFVRFQGPGGQLRGHPHANMQKQVRIISQTGGAVNIGNMAKNIFAGKRDIYAKVQKDIGLSGG